MRISRTVVNVTFIPRPKCSNCRRRPAILQVTREHVTACDGVDPHRPGWMMTEGRYQRTARLCQPCANDVINDENEFLDTIIDDGKPPLYQRDTCIVDWADYPVSPGQLEQCMCNGCRAKLEALDADIAQTDWPEVVHTAGTNLVNS